MWDFWVPGFIMPIWNEWDGTEGARRPEKNCASSHAPLTEAMCPATIESEREATGMKLVYKIWLMNDIGRTFGEGPYLLLKGVERTGSLKEAAARTGMAYSKARRVMECCERSLGFALTVRKKGGVTGGGSEVTGEAAELMSAYESLRTEIEEAIGRTYEKHFGHEVPVEFYKMITQKRGPRKKPAE